MGNKWVSNVHLCANCLEVCTLNARGWSRCCGDETQLMEMFDSSMPKLQRSLLFGRWRRQRYRPSKVKKFRRMII